MEISAQMIEHEIEIFGITEANTHWNNDNIFRMVLQQIKKRNNNKVHLYASDASITWSKLYKPGGTAIMTKGKITN